jgi:hypothetical protein
MTREAIAMMDALNSGEGVQLRSSWLYTSEVTLRISYKIGSVSTLWPAAPDLRNARLVQGRLRLWSLIFHKEESHWNAQ